MTSPALLPVHSLAAEIAALRLSPVDVPEDYLTRIDRLIGKLQASVSVNATRARFTPEAAAGNPARARLRRPRDRLGPRPFRHRGTRFRRRSRAERPGRRRPVRRAPSSISKGAKAPPAD